MINPRPPLALMICALLWTQAPTAHAERLPVCYGFGCQTRVEVQLSAEEWSLVTRWLTPAAPDPAAEREQLRHAIGWIEVLVGRHTPTHNDLGFNLPDDGRPVPEGQLDCIDESINTTAYLQRLQDVGLMRHHRVLERAYRKALLDQHWAGLVQEIDSGARYVIDSWFDPNGYLPIVQPLEEWSDLSLFSR